MELGWGLAARSCTVASPFSRPRRPLAGVHMRRNDERSLREAQLNCLYSSRALLPSGGTSAPLSRTSEQLHSPQSCRHWAPRTRSSASTLSIARTPRC
eukprot:4120105-Pleurochrysis_carterae.AAC.1